MNVSEWMCEKMYYISWKDVCTIVSQRALCRAYELSIKRIVIKSILLSMNEIKHLLLSMKQNIT